MPRKPAPDEMLTMAPLPCASIVGSTALHMRKVDVRLSASIRCHSASVRSRVVLPGRDPPTTLAQRVYA